MPEGPDYITVVSGLPRSGTSLMMQMLQAGGMPVLTDGVRPADEDNPRGYWEFEPVKRLQASHDWVHQAAGKAVKVVHALVSSLPGGFVYRVIVMRRDLREVLASQRVMLERVGKSGAKLSDDRLAEIFAAQLDDIVAGLRNRADCSVLEVQHRDLIERAAAVIPAVHRFLDNKLDAARMAAVIDPALYRQRADQ